MALRRLLVLAVLTLGVGTLCGCRTAPLSDMTQPEPARVARRLERAPLPRTEWIPAAARTERVLDGSTTRGVFRMVADQAPAGGGEAAASGGGDLAKAAQNPLADMISLPFQNNTNFRIGPNYRAQNVLNIQPVLPVKFGKWLVVNRLIVPVIRQPDSLQETGSTTGLGDINYTAWIVPPTKGPITWGVGPAFVFPTRTADELGKGKWGLGPSAVVIATPGKFVVGALINNIWSLGGGGGENASEAVIEDEVNQMLFQYFVNYNLPNGWYLVSAPIITANWKADPGQKWTVPFGGGIGKLLKIGKQPVNTSVQAYYNVETPFNGPDWQIRIQVQLLFPAN